MRNKQLKNIYMLQIYNIFIHENVPETKEQQGRKDPSVLKKVQIWPEMTSLAIKHARRTELRSLVECGYDFEKQGKLFKWMWKCKEAEFNVNKNMYCHFILRLVALTANNNVRR